MDPLFESHLTVDFNTTSKLGISITTYMWKTEYLTPPDIFYFGFVYYYTEIWMAFSLIRTLPLPTLVEVLFVGF